MRRLREKIIDYSYILTLTISILVYLLFSFLVIKDGSIQLNDFSGYNWFDWLLFTGNIVLPTFVGLMINTSFRRMGYKAFRDEEEIKELYKEYHELLKTKKTNKKHVTIEQYMQRQNAKDAVFKSMIGSGMMFLAGTLIITASFDTFLSTILVLLMWIVMGVLSMMKLYDYGMNEGREALEYNIQALKEENEVKTNVEDLMIEILEVQVNGNN